MKRIVAAVLLALVAGCKKAPPPAPVTKAAEEAPQIVSPLPMPLALRIPQDVEGCVCSAGFRAWHASLIQTNWWRLVAAWLDEKMPLGGSWAETARAINLEDVALMAGPGSSQAVATLRDLNDLYNEARYRMMLAQLIPGAASAPLDQPALDELVLSLERFEVPPFLAIAHGGKAHEWLKQLTSMLMSLPAFEKAPTSSITTTHGEQIGVSEVDGSLFLPREVREGLLKRFDQALPRLHEATRGKLARALEVIAGKTFVIALGQGKGTAFFGVAHKKDQIRLADGPEDSVLARSELAFGASHARKPLLGMAFWQPELSVAMRSPELTAPLRRALLGAVPVKAEERGRWITALQQAGEAERRLLVGEAAAVGALAWWDRGLQIDMHGGSAGEELKRLRQPSRFHALADAESVVMAMCGDVSREGALRAVMESWARLLDVGSALAADTGLLGPKERLTWRESLTKALPGLLEAYDASKAMWQKGLARDGAFILDTGGRMPPLPGLPAGAESMPLPRLVSVHAVANRALIGTTWTRLEAGLKTAAGAVSPAVLPLWPVADTVQSRGLTTHSFPLSFGSEDLMPCASISEELMMWGTSRALQQAVVGGKLDASSSGCRLRVHFGRLRDFLRAYSKARGASNPGDVGLRETVRWLAPLGVLDWQVFADEEGAHSVFSCELTDIPAYD